MTRDSPNHYRTLFVQSDAPPEVIKAAWRALMSARRAHPDLGGDHDEAVRLNTAYEVLGDPARRAAYDLSLRATAAAAAASSSGWRPHSATAATAPTRDRPGSAAYGPGRTCPFCQQPHAGSLRRDSRCNACSSPLMPLPERGSRSTDPHDEQGRRKDPRFERDAVVQLWLPGERQARPARLKDLSFSGLQVHTPDALPRGQVVRVVAPWFEALFTVVGCRGLRNGHAIHGRLLTLMLQQQAKGVYVDSQA